MFSVIIPVYNKADYIEKAIHSVLTQSFGAFELIIVNDGSTDQSLIKVEQFKDERIKIINQQNQGVSVARNNGVNAAKYDFIAFLDADDWWETIFLREMKNLIEEFPDAGIFGSGYFIIKNGMKHIASIGVDSDFEKGIINYCRVYSRTLNMPLTSISVVIPKSVFESNNGFNPTLKLGEDFDLWLRVADKHPVAFLNKPLANYNQDVEIAGRAVGARLYEPEQHMLFSDYSAYSSHTDFRYLFERLALYSLLPYYLADKNISEVNIILSNIRWKNHSYKYQLYYRLLPKILVIYWMNFLKFGSKIKRRLKTFTAITNE